MDLTWFPINQAPQDGTIVFVRNQPDAAFFPAQWDTANGGWIMAADAQGMAGEPTEYADIPSDQVGQWQVGP
jgi:hypothetical protein